MIPHIPASVEQAHAEYGKIGPIIRNGIQDIETELVQLLARDTGKNAIPTAIRVPYRDVEPAQFFSLMLNDEKFTQLQDGAVAAWEAWQTDISKFGSVWFNNGDDLEEGVIKGEDAELKTRLRGQIRLVAMTVKIQSTRYDIPIGELIRQETRLATANIRKVVANKNAPPLAQSWNELVDYVNACAIRMADFDAPPKPYTSEDLVRLQLKAKINFLERCRVTLWCCHAVWAQMTTSTNLPPLKNLRS